VERGRTDWVSLIKKSFWVMVRVRVDSDWVGLGLRSNIIDFFWISVISGRVWLSFGFL
jgi:hypothetical protein